MCSCRFKFVVVLCVFVVSIAVRCMFVVAFVFVVIVVSVAVVMCIIVHNCDNCCDARNCLRSFPFSRISIAVLLLLPINPYPFNIYNYSLLF